MAYQDWTSYRFTQVWSNGKYAIDVQWRYKQDPVANTTFYSATALRVRSLDSYHRFNNSSASAGIGTIVGNRQLTTVNANVSAGGSQTFNLTDVGVEVSHRSDGSIGQQLNVHGYFDAKLGGSYDTPTGGWNTTDVANQISSIDRNAPTITSSISSFTQTSVKLKLTSNYSTSRGTYSINGGDWTGFTTPSQLQSSGGGTGYITISGLKPNTRYTIQVDCKRDYNGVWSNKASVTFTTPKPNAPIGGSVSVGSISTNQAIVSWSGFRADSLASISSYSVEVSEDGKGTPISVSSNTNSYRWINLKPNTTYYAYVKAYDNFGSSSAWVKSNSFKTLNDQAKVLLKSNGTWKKAKVWVKSNGTWKKAKNIYAKKGYEWKIIVK